MKAINIIILSALLIGISSCYKDKGNYDYDAALEISIDSIQKSYITYTFVDTLKITPTISPSNSEYDCWWGVYPTNVQQSVALDTICYSRDLEFPITLAPGTYSLVFCAKEKVTGVAQIVETPLTTLTSLSKGWYVLRTQDGYTDFDLFTGTDKIENVIAANNDGRNLKGEARAVAHLTRYKSWDDESSRYANVNTIFALSSEDMAAIRVDEGTIIHTFEDMFFEAPEIVLPQDVFGGDMDIFFMNNGKIYSIYNMMANSGRFGEAKTGNYSLSSYRIYDVFSNPLLYDENSCSFCSANSTDTELIPFAGKANDMNADLLFMGPTSYGAYALMKMKQEDRYLMLNLDTYAYAYSDPILSCDTLENTIEIVHADHWASSTINQIIYYSQENNIYSCNIGAKYEIQLQVALPAQEKVTYMRHLTFNNTENNFNYLAVASHDGENYKVYLYEIQAGKLQENPKILEGQGKVGALIYIESSKSTALK